MCVPLAEWPAKRLPSTNPMHLPWLMHPHVPCAGEEVTVRLLNYTKSGKPFWNLLTVRGGHRPAQHSAAQRSTAQQYTEIQHRSSPGLQQPRQFNATALPRKSNALCMALCTPCTIHLYSCTASHPPHSTCSFLGLQVAPILDGRGRPRLLVGVLVRATAGVQRG